METPLFQPQPSRVPAPAKSESIYSDLNTLFGEESTYEILLDKAAVIQGLKNVFRTVAGEAMPIFEPMGSLLPDLLHEPLDATTASKVRAAAIHAAKRWEPRIDIDVGNTKVFLDYSLPGFRVYLAFRIRASGEIGVAEIPLSQRDSACVAPPPTSQTVQAEIPWTPIALPGLAAWYDASLPNNFARNLAGIVSWKDFSGRKNTATAQTAIGLQRYQWTPSLIKSSGALEVATRHGTQAGAPMLLQNGYVYGNKDIHLFAVVTSNLYDETGPYGNVGFSLFARGTSPGDDPDALLQINFGNGGLPYVKTKFAGFEARSSSVLSMKTTDATTLIEVHYYAENNVVQHIINGQETAVVQMPALSSTPFPSFLLPMLGDQLGDSKSGLCEVVMVDTSVYTSNVVNDIPMLDPDLQTLRDYLNAKWNWTS